MGTIATAMRLRSGVDVDVVLNTIEIDGGMITAGVIRADRRDGLPMSDAEQDEVRAWESAYRGS